MLWYYFVVLLTVIVESQSDTACSKPLGMEKKEINDDQITVSSKPGAKGRLRENKGAWCPKQDHHASQTDMFFDQYIQIDLLNITKITKFATQGRYYDGTGMEYSQKFKISYSFDITNWIYFKERGNVKEFPGNYDTDTIVSNELKPPFIARYVRVHPGYFKSNQVCLRVELYGCAWKENGKAIRSYSAPEGDSVNDIHYKDTKYTGSCVNGICMDGVGLLTNGENGPTNSKESDGVGWLGWYKDNAEELAHISITFEFYNVRAFKDVTITMNVNADRGNQLFNKSEIFFGNIQGSFSNVTNYLEYCPEQKDGIQNVNVLIPLCENIGRFVKFQFLQTSKWMLISEIKFNSVPSSAELGNGELKKCDKSKCYVPVGPTEMPVNTKPSTASPGYASTEGYSGSSTNNTRTIIVIVCVALLVLIIVLVLLFFLYRRRMFCFGRFKHQDSKDDITGVHVELHDRDSMLDPSYDKVHDTVGNPLYASVSKDEEKQPMLPVSPLGKKPDLSLNIKIPDTQEPDVYSVPQTTSSPKVLDEYAEPVDSLKSPTESDDIEANPIYEGVYSEPLYGITGTILVGPQEETLKRGYTMERFPSDHLVFKEKIGDGQFGEVHIAEARIGDLNSTFGEEYKGKSKITVAVKTLKQNVSTDVRTDFFKEVRVMSRLQHENVVRLLGVCREQPVCMIVEYMENGDLNQFLRGHVLEGDDEEMMYANTKRPIKYQQLVYISSQIAAGMKYFASMNFVHRDLAARNCLVGDGLTVKLADFGMSRLLYTKHYYRVQGRVMLPIRWMAPESIFQGRFTTQTDVWSFGITLWEVFTLSMEFPYPDLSDEEVIANAKTAFTKQPSSEVVYNGKPDVCEQDIYGMLMRCWSSNPKSRPEFANMHALLLGKVDNVGSLAI